MSSEGAALLVHYMGSDMSKKAKQQSVVTCESDQSAKEGTLPGPALDHQNHSTKGALRFAQCQTSAKPSPDVGPNPAEFAVENGHHPTTWIDAVRALGACPDAVAWCQKVEAVEGAPVEVAWRRCDRADWMVWLWARCLRSDVDTRSLIGWVTSFFALAGGACVQAAPPDVSPRLLALLEDVHEWAKRQKRTSVEGWARETIGWDALAGEAPPRSVECAAYSAAACLSDACAAALQYDAEGLARSLCQLLRFAALAVARATHPKANEEKAAFVVLARWVDERVRDQWEPSSLALGLAWVGLDPAHPAHAIRIETPWRAWLEAGFPIEDAGAYCDAGFGPAEAMAARIRGVDPRDEEWRVAGLRAVQS